MIPDSPFDAHEDAALAAPVRGQVVAIILLALVALVLPGQARAATKPQKGFDPTLPSAPVSAPLAGAIFNVNAGYAALIEGPRAHAVGDVLTITLVENLTTTKQAIGKTQKSGSFSVTPPTAGPFVINPNALNAAGASAFNGQGDASQKSQLGGQITVTVAEVRRNGTLLVKGEKRLLLSQGEEWVQLSGIVRVADIDPDNSVQSGRIADARVVYTGNGSVGRASREGWLSKFFSIITPF